MSAPGKGTAANSGSNAGRGGATPVQGKDRDMGSTLRTVYQSMIDEAVPDEMLDLLGKLN